MMARILPRMIRGVAAAAAFCSSLVALSACQGTSSVLGTRFSYQERERQAAVAKAGACGGDANACVERCRKGDAGACNAAAVVMEFGIAGAPDYRQASQLYGQACRGDYAQGCNNLGWMFALGKGVERSPSTAMVLFTKAFDGYRVACLSGEIQGCVLATNLLREGLVHDQDDAQLAALTRRACELGHAPSCGAGADDPY